MRKSSSKRRHQPSSSSSSALQSEELVLFDPFGNILSDPDLTQIHPRVSELLDRGVDLDSTFLIHSFETYQEPPLTLGSPKLESDLGVHLPEYKPTDFICPTTYSFPATSEQPEATFSIYLNPLFETKEDIQSQVQKLVIKTPLKSYRRSPPC